jgi:segregation and condensation protein B
MAEATLETQLEALLFVAHEPLSLERLAKLVSSDKTLVKQALKLLETRFQKSGLRLSHLDGAYRLVTAPEADDTVRRYLQAEARADLSRPALEALAIIAYRGPLTRTQLDEIRGVTSDTMIRNLLQRGLISEHGAANEPSKPMLYTVSHAFLQHFGLSSLGELPPLRPVEER